MSNNLIYVNNFLPENNQKSTLLLLTSKSTKYLKIRNHMAKWLGFLRK